MKHLQVVVVMLMALLSQAVAGQETNQETKFPEWKPPPSRAKSLTLLAPKAFNHNNIFKGEAEQWLAEAIIKLESPYLQPYKDAEISAYISKLGKYLTQFSESPNKKFQFVVTDDSDVNAFSIGGGRVYICRGLLEEVKSEDELAGVIGHEIGHDTLLHTPKTVTRQLFWMNGTTKINTAADAEKALGNLLEKFSNSPVSVFMEAVGRITKSLEIEADRAGFYIAYKAGYNSLAMQDFFMRIEQLQKKERGKTEGMTDFVEILFASHPANNDRKNGFGWESNFVKMPPKDAVINSPAFTAMKAKLK